MVRGVGATLTRGRSRKMTGGTNGESRVNCGGRELKRIGMRQ